MEQQEAIPKGGKVELVQSADKLTYRQRIAKAAKLGRDNKTDPKLKALINDLRQHPNPPAVEREVEEGFSNMLPSQQKDIAKYYNEDQMALVAAAASHENLAVLKEELNSKSISFKKFVAKEVVRQDASDSDVAKQILSAPRAVRQQMITKCVKFRRVAVLEQILPEMLRVHGPDSIARFLHGCNPAIVKQYLTKDLRVNKNINWKHLARYHGPVIVSLMEVELAVASFWNRSKLYDQWEEILTPNGMKELLFNGRQSLAMLDLVRKYTPAVYIGGGAAPQKLEDQQRLPREHLIYQLPSFMTTLMQHFFNHKSTAAPMGDFFLQNIDDCCDYVRVIEPCIIKYFSPADSLKFMKAVFAKSTPATRRITHSYEIVILRDMPVTLTNFSMEELLEFSTVIASFYQKCPVEGVTAGAALRVIYKELDRRVNKAMKNGLKNDRPADLTKITKIFNDINELLLPLAFPRLDSNKNISDLVPEHSRSYFEYENVVGVLNACPSVPGMMSALFDRLAKLFATKEAFPNATGLDSVCRGRPIVATAIMLELLFTFMKGYISRYQKASKNERFPEDQRLLAVAAQSVLLTKMFHLFTRDPITNIQAIKKIFPYLTPDLREKFITDNLWENDRMAAAINQDYESALQLFNLVPIKTIQPLVKSLLTEAQTLTEVSRDILLAYQDIEDHEVRKQMQKAADSTNVAERIAAIKRLVVATVLSKSSVQVGRTLKFIRDKIKNETIENRNEVLNSLIYATGPVGPHNTVLRRDQKELYANSFLRDDTPQEQFDTWLQMLQDVIDAPDLNRVNTDDYTAVEQHPTFKHFWTLSKSALARGCEFSLTEEGNTNSLRFHAFAFEIQWRIGLYVRGERKAVEKFRLATLFSSPTTTLVHKRAVSPNVPVTSHDPFKRRPLLAKRFINNIMAIAGPKFKERFPRMKFHDLGHFFGPLFHAANAYWNEIPVLAEYLTGALDNLKKNSKKDEEGLLIIEHDNPIFSVFEPLLRLKRQAHWSKVPILNDFVETILRSRQAPIILKQWMYHHEVYLTKKGTKAQRSMKRDEVVRTLLSINSSALHLKFVWRHLFNNRQDLLDKYINDAEPKTYRSVFYVDPDNRTLYKKVHETKMVIEARVRTRRPRGGAKSSVLVRGAIMPRAVYDIRGIIVKQSDAEERINDEISSDGDHRDFFTFEACFNLHKLLPRQSLALAAQWIRQALNSDRPMPERIKAIIRWTLLPSTAYYDIVKFLNEYEKSNEATRRAALPVNLIEPVLRGAMYGDEPTAALRWLLSPEFLGSNRARVAIYAIAQAVPYLPDDGLTKICRNILTGKNRHQLKVTAFKEIMRLLTALPTGENIAIVMHEWNRKEIHRDVAIAIIQCAFSFLRSPEERKSSLGWEIIESVVDKYPTHIEILASLLATRVIVAELYLKVPIEVNAEELQQPRLKDLIEDLALQEIPKKFFSEYFNKVLKRLVELPSLDEDDDVKHLARVNLLRWSSVCVENEANYAAEVAIKFLMNFKSKLLRSTKVGDQRVHYQRSITIWKLLAGMCGINCGPTYIYRDEESVPWPMADKQFFVSAVQQYTTEIDRLSKTKCSAEETRVRVILLNVFDAVLNDGLIWPAHAVTKNFYDSATEVKLLEPIEALGDLYWLETTKRRINLLKYEFDHVPVIVGIKKALDGVLQRPSYTQDVVAALVTYAQEEIYLGAESREKHEADTLRTTVHKVLDQLMNDKYFNADNDTASATLLTVLRVKMITVAVKYVEYEPERVAGLIYTGLMQLAHGALHSDFDLFADIVNLFQTACSTLSPRGYDRVRTLGKYTTKFVQSVINTCLHPASPRTLLEDRFALQLVTELMEHSAQELVASIKPAEVDLVLLLIYAVLVHKASALLTTDQLEQTSRMVVQFCGEIYGALDQNYNATTGERDIWNNQSKTTSAILTQFFSKKFLEFKRDELQTSQLTAAVDQLTYHVGIALLNEFPWYLWRHADAFEFILSTIAFTQQRASAQHVMIAVTAALKRSMAASWSRSNQQAEDENEDTDTKENKQNHDLEFTVKLLRQLMDEKENGHLTRSLALDLLTQAARETATGDEFVTPAALVTLLEEFYSDVDDTLRIKALKVQTSGKRFK